MILMNSVYGLRFLRGQVCVCFSPGWDIDMSMKTLENIDSHALTQQLTQLEKTVEP